jgi:transcriptional regulator with XRE-family HTH domain
MTLQELARMTGISQSYLSEIENGHYNNPSYTKSVSLCKAFGCSVNAATREIDSSK